MRWTARVIHTVAVLTVALWVSGAWAEMVLRRGNLAEPTSLDPQKISGTWESNIVSDLFLGLTTYDAHGNTVPGAAERWEQSEDGRTYRFYLRAGLVWSDGTPFTADDVVFSFRRLLDPMTAADYASNLYILVNGREANAGQAPLDSVGVRAVDAQTVELQLINPVPYILELFTHASTYPVPHHVVKAHGAGWARPGVMVSSGAYVLKSWEPQKLIKIVKNPRFYDAANVAVDTVYFYPIEDSQTALKQFRNGQLDMNNSFPSRQFGWLKTHMPNEVKVSPMAGVYYYAFQTERPPFNDARVRRALTMTIPREAITEKVLTYGIIPAYSFVPPGIANYPQSAAMDFKDWPWEERVEQARKLLAEAGYGPHNPLTVTLSYNTDKDHKKVALVAAHGWKQIGVRTHLINSEAKVHYNSLKVADFQVARAAWIADYNDPENFLFLMASSTGQLNYSRYVNPAYDALLRRAAVTLDLAERADILRQAEAIAMQDLPVAPIYFYVSRNLVHTWVKGWHANVNDVYLSRYLRIEGRP
jgi:oligopeptide transport system substrate-binding protein